MATLMDYDGTFFRGANSDSDPSQLPLGYYFSGINVINQGGRISCRPGYQCRFTFPEGKLQGGAFFRPKIGLEQMIVIVDGFAYVSEFPFTSFTQLAGIQFSATAKQIFFALTEQSARRLTDDLGSAIEVLASPRVVLFMQDGGETAPAYYDGSEAGHIRDAAFETPIGGPMRWVGDRLWVASGSFLRASDISNPFSFRETLYLGGTDAFTFAGDITALGSTPSLEFPQLLVFTESNCSLVKANIRVRSQWQEEPDMQREIFKVGSISQRSVVEKFGQLMWYSPSGIVFFDSALLSKQSARLPIRDNEMGESKAVLNGDLSLVAGGAFGQYMLMSVPAESQFNTHTWALNNASLETLTDASGPSWAGLWIGTQPVEWMCGVVASQERAYYISKDSDGQNRLWEAFSPDRLDNGCPITWAAATRGYFGQTSQARKNAGDDCVFRYAEVTMTGIEEDMDIGIFYAGSLRGAFKKIANKTIRVERGNIDATVEIDMGTELFAFKAQSRRIRSQDVNSAAGSVNSGSCPVERDINEDRDESFQLLIVCHGPGTISRIRAFADGENDSETGDPEACGSEDEIRAIRFDGTGVKADTIAQVQEILSEVLTNYSSNQTETVRESVGVGFAESIVSQEAADRVASSIATKMADAEAILLLPVRYSAGLTDA